MPIVWITLSLAVGQTFCWLMSRGLGRRIERHVVVLGLVLPLLVLAPWFQSSRLLFPGDFLRHVIPGAPDLPGSDRHQILNDPVFLFIPWELEVRHALRQGRLPVWSDLLEGGSSPWTNPQAGVLSPLALATREVPIQYWLLAMLALGIQLSFQGTWLLARRLAVRRLPSLLAAGGFSCAGGVMSWALFPVTATVVWVPWLTVGVIALFRERLRPRRIAAVSFMIAALVLSGHPETAGIGGLFAGICGLGLRARRRNLAASLGAAALAASLGFGLTAPVLVPFLRSLPGSQRAQELTTHPLPHVDITLGDPTTWFIPQYRAFLLAPLNPHAFGRPFQDAFSGPFNWAEADSGYAGLIAFVGSVLAAVHVRRRRAWPFLGFAIVGFLLAARFWPLVLLTHSIAPLRLLYYPRFLSVCTLALAVAGALGIDRWLRSRRKWRFVPALGIAAALSLIVRLDPTVAALWLLIAAAAGLAAWRPRWGAAALGAALLLDLVPWAWCVLPSGNPAFFYPRTDFLADLQREAAQGGPWRATGEDFAIYPCLLPVYGIAEIRPHNPLAPKAYLEGLDAAFGFQPSMAAYFARLRGVGHPFLDFLNVRYVVWESWNPVPAGWERIDRGTTRQRLYRNPDALPRWFVPEKIDVIAREDFAAWVRALDDGRRVAVFQEDSGKGAILAPPPARLRTLNADPGRIVLAVTAPEETLLATSLQLPAGWSARSEQGPLRTLVVNSAFLGVRIPRGEHRVELRFLPPGLIPGVAIGGLSLLVCGLLLLRNGGRP